MRSFINVILKYVSCALVFAKMSRIIFSVILVTIILKNVKETSAGETGGVFDTIKNGFKIAGKFLGLDKASGVAELVSEAFHHKNRRNDENGEKNVFSGFLRIFGFDAKKMGAIAINAIIFVAQLISTSLSKQPPVQVTRGRENRGIKEDPYNWLLKNEGLKELLKSSKDSNLADHITEYIKERSLDEDSGCLQLLICKSSPFITSMQNVIKAKENEKRKGVDAMFQFMPTLDEFSDHSDDCESKFPHCTITY